MRSMAVKDKEYTFTLPFLFSHKEQESFPFAYYISQRLCKFSLTVCEANISSFLRISIQVPLPSIQGTTKNQLPNLVKSYTFSKSLKERGRKEIYNQYIKSSLSTLLPCNDSFFNGRKKHIEKGVPFSSIKQATIYGTETETVKQKQAT